MYGLVFTLILLQPITFIIHRLVPLYLSLFIDIELFQYWSGSEHAKLFVDSLLEINPEMRLSAIDALRHDWILGEQRVHLNVSFLVLLIKSF